MCKISEMNLETAKYYGYEAQSNRLVEECAELICYRGLWSLICYRV